MNLIFGTFGSDGVQTKGFRKSDKWSDANEKKKFRTFSQFESIRESYDVAYEILNFDQIIETETRRLAASSIEQFPFVLFITRRLYNLVRPLKSMDEIRKCDHYFS